MPLTKPITAPRETVPKDGLRGALGYGVILPEQAQNATTAEPTEGVTIEGDGAALGGEAVGGVPVPTGYPDGAALDPGGLGTVADEADPLGRWVGGYTLEGDPCGVTPYRFAVDLCDDGTRELPANGVPPVNNLPAQKAFAIGQAVECSTFGDPDQLANYRTIARRLLDLSRWSQIAHELWTGDLVPTNRHLASSEATILGGGAAVSLTEGIAALEDAFGSELYGAVQLIHAPRKMSAYLDNANLVHTSAGSGRLWTANDSLVIADRGYPGTDPDGDLPTDGTVWLYSTGVMAARLGAVRDEERDDGDAVHYETNDRIVRVAQPAGIAWLCGHFAVRVCYQ